MANLSKLPHAPRTNSTPCATLILEQKGPLPITKRFVKATKRFFTKAKKKNDRKCLQGPVLNEEVQRNHLPVDTVLALSQSTAPSNTINTREVRGNTHNTPLAQEENCSDWEHAMERFVEKARHGGDQTVDLYPTEDPPVSCHSDSLSVVLIPETPFASVNLVPPSIVLAPTTPAKQADESGFLTSQGSTPERDALRASFKRSAVTVRNCCPSNDNADIVDKVEPNLGSQLQADMEDLKRQTDIRDREHAAKIAELKEQHESELNAVINALETVNWKKLLAENRLKVAEDDKRELDGKHKALIKRLEAAETLIKSKDSLIERTSWTNQTLQQRLDDLKLEEKKECKETTEAAENLNDNDSTILELRAHVLEVTSDLFNVSQSSQKADAPSDGPKEKHSVTPVIGRDQLAGSAHGVEEYLNSQQANEIVDWEQSDQDTGNSTSQQLTANLWEQPNHGISVEARYQETAEQCEMLQAELNATKIERDALAMAAVEAKAESDWWFSGEAWWDKEETPIGDDVKQQLVYKDRLLIDLNKRVDKGMTALKELKERSRTEREDQAAQISTLQEKLEIATSNLERSRHSRESISNGYKAILDMLKRKLYQSDIVDAISYYYDIVSSDNAALVGKVELQAADLERLRERIILGDLYYRDLSRTSAQQSSTIIELETTKRSLEVELGRHEAEAVIGAQERKEEAADYERQLEQANAQYKILGEKVQTIFRLGASERTKAELDQKDQLREKLDNQLWDCEQRIDDLQARSKVDMEARAEDAKFAAMQDREYEAYKERLFAAEAEVVALKAELAERDEMLDGSNPLHLKEANVYRQALDTEKLDRREQEEKVAEEFSLLRQRWEAKVEALVAMGNLLWARTRRLQASRMASGHELGEESGGSESIDAACRSLFGMEDGGSRDGSRIWTEVGI
ncbi:MAG: hypothetical protein LQ347_004558 [Umbilicaria vellea]|nr:MAG: hypothetical protein LQ347_004558 [Umbilicaria vellea]